MKMMLFIVIWLLPAVNILSGSEDYPDPVLLLNNVMKRMENIDQSYIIDMEQTQTGKPDVHRRFLTRIGWLEGKIRQAIRIDYLLPAEMKGVVFWEQRFTDHTRKRWRTLPVTGKLKELKKTSDKSIRKKGFDFSELELTPEMINSHSHTVVGADSLLGRKMIIVESQDTTRRRKDRETKRLWIDPERNLIMKVVVIDGRDRVIKTAACTEVREIDGKFVYGKIEVREKKKKQNVVIRMENYSFEKINKPEIFIPKNQ